MYRFALRRSECVFFQNPDDRNLFLELGIVPEQACTVVVNGSGVDVSRFALMPVPRGPVCFLMICRLLGDKGVREYAAAAERVRVAHPEARFYLAGWIDENPDSIEQRELDEWVKRGVIEFLGKLDDVRPAIERCAVYVLPSYREGTPRTVLEAMSMGRAIITTDAPGCRETVVDGQNGFLIAPRSVDALVASMERFIEDPELAVRMGGVSRKIAESKYDVHKVNEVMMRGMGIAE
jgi:glycosyltransferase involved in cell wall biosynthesis